MKEIIIRKRAQIKGVHTPMTLRQTSQGISSSRPLPS